MMSTISTDPGWITANEPQAIERANEDNMIVSYTRHRRTADDVTYTYQFPLSRIKPVSTLEEFRAGMKYMLRVILDVDADDYSVIWRMSETGQIGFVRSKNSFDAAVLDHKNANKKVVQVFVVSNDNIHCVPELDFFK
ncbi:hypothetical protein KCU95_g2792, partial [Aureobasidium melanogenum]